MDLSHPKLQGFDILQTNYKTVGDQGIRSDILIPQNSLPGKRPVIVRFHGGGLVVGDSLLMYIWPQWLSDLALQHNAVLISPNYRLMPEATAPEIHEDVEDFWTWLHSSALRELLAAHKTPVELGLSRVITTGESAGGLLSISLALSHPDDIRAAAVTYPMVDLTSPDFVEPRQSPPAGIHTPEAHVKDTIASATPGAAESSLVSEARAGFMYGAIEHGYIGGLYQRGIEDPLKWKLWYPLERLEESGIKIPQGGITVIHGREDSVVPLRGSEKFVTRARQVTKGFPTSDHITLTVRDGDHGFDLDSRLEEPWLQDSFKTAIETWLE